MDHLISLEDARKDLFSLAARLAENIKSADGHAGALSRIVPIYVERGEVDIAAELSDTIADPYARDRLLTLVAEKCAANDDLDYAFQLAEAIEDDGVAAEARERIAIRLAAGGNIDRAIETAETLDHPDNVYGELAAKFDADGIAERRDEMIDTIEFAMAKIGALNALAAIAINQGDHKKAVTFLDRSVAVADEVDYETDETRALTEIGSLFVAAKRKDRAIETLDKARQIAEKIDSVHREYLLSGVSSGFFSAGSVDLADRVLDLITDKTHLASTLLGFSRSYWESNEKSDAVEALDEAYQILRSQAENETRDSRSKFQLWRSIAAQFAGFEKYERAIETAQEHPDPDEQADALSEIAQIATLHGQDDFADQAYRAIDEDSKRVTTLIRMADAHVHREEIDAAKESLNAAFELADSVPQLGLRSSAYNELAVRFAKLGDPDRAREISHLNFDTIVTIRDESVRSISFANLALIYESMGLELTDVERDKMTTLIQKAEW